MNKQAKYDELKRKRAKIKRLRNFHYKIEIWRVFADAADSSHNVYFSWLMLTICIVLSLPFLPFEILMIPVMKWDERMRKQCYNLMIEMREAD